MQLRARLLWILEFAIRFIHIYFDDLELLDPTEVEVEPFRIFRSSSSIYSEKWGTAVFISNIQLSSSALLLLATKHFLNMLATGMWGRTILRNFFSSSVRNDSRYTKASFTDLSLLVLFTCPTCAWTFHSSSRYRDIRITLSSEKGSVRNSPLRPPATNEPASHHQTARDWGVKWLNHLLRRINSSLLCVTWYIFVNESTARLWNRNLLLAPKCTEFMAEISFSEAAFHLKYSSSTLLIRKKNLQSFSPGPNVK